MVNTYTWDLCGQKEECMILVAQNSFSISLKKRNQLKLPTLSVSATACMRRKEPVLRKRKVGQFGKWLDRLIQNMSIIGY